MLGPQLEQQQAGLLFLVEKLHEGEERELVEPAEKLQAPVEAAPVPRLDHLAVVEVLGQLAEEGQLMVHELDGVAELERAAVDARAVDVGAVGAGEIDQQHVGARDFQHSVLAADFVVVEDNIVAVEPPDVEDCVGRDFVDNLPIHNEVYLSQFSSNCFHNRDLSV